MGGFDAAAATDILQRELAPWVQDLDLSVTHVGTDRATIAMRVGPRTQRAGGVVCGQALTALADTAMVLAISAASGGYRPMTTVGQSVSFMKPATGARVAAEARVLRLGKSLAFGEIAITDGGALVAHATATYAILGPVGATP